MTEPETKPPPIRRIRLCLQLGAALVMGAAAVAVMWIWDGLRDREAEARRPAEWAVTLSESDVDPAQWGRNFPRQYDSYRAAPAEQRTKHGGNTPYQKLDEDPRWKILLEGNPFGVDWHEERGHTYILSDQDESERLKKFNLTGACLHCHASVLPVYRAAGGGDVMKGFEIVCAMPYADARRLVSHPMSCQDCHDPESMRLRVTRPAFLNAIGILARSDRPLPALPSVEQWRKAGRTDAYDPNALASHHEMRTFVCAQCHVEYYFHGEGKRVTYPWRDGVTVEAIESYYDDIGFADWTHPTSGAPGLKAQHPEFEMWSQGLHARSGVSCADCHMPYERRGAVKATDHQVRSPLLTIARSCQICHRAEEDEIRARAETLQDRIKASTLLAEDAVVSLIAAVDRAAKTGATDGDLMAVRRAHRRAQWRLDFVAAENSTGFHASGEAARILAEAIDIARTAETEAVRIELRRR